MTKDLDKREDELQKIFARQLEMFKAESGSWIKIGGIVLVGGIVAFAILKSKSKKKDRQTLEALSVLDRAGLLTKEIEQKLTNKSTSSFWPSISERLLVMGLAIAKEKFFPNIFQTEVEDAKVEG
jgi:hypothetical protein